MIRLLLVCLGLTAIPAGIVLSRPVEIPPGTAVERSRAPLPELMPMSLDSLSSALIAHDPFRPEREPSPTPFSITPLEAAYIEPSPPKPDLLVTGIIWGATPSAVIEGLPGLDGARLMRVGEIVNGIRLRRVSENQVILTGMDTSWALTMRKPW